MSVLKRLLPVKSVISFSKISQVWRSFLIAVTSVSLLSYTEYKIKKLQEQGILLYPDANKNQFTVHDTGKISIGGPFKLMR